MFGGEGAPEPSGARQPKAGAFARRAAPEGAGNAVCSFGSEIALNLVTSSVAFASPRDVTGRGFGLAAFFLSMEKITRLVRGPRGVEWRTRTAGEKHTAIVQLAK